MPTMKALRKRGPVVEVACVPRPAPGSEEILVRVAVAGVCRTDLAVAEGRLACPDPLILGHEFSGVAEASGPAVRHVRPGDRVAVMPIVPCMTCPSCRGGHLIACLRRHMLGLDRDGAFAEFVAVPARCVFRIAEGVSFHAAAYAEPVAAALAVLNADIRPGQAGLLYGDNRFAHLIARILRARGFRNLTLHDPAAGRPEADAYEFLIETVADDRTLSDLIRAARPGATVVLRSRPPGPIPLDVTAALPKEITFRAVNYGPFPRALALLAEGQVGIDDLLGPAYALEDFADVFARARRCEAVKLFLSPSGDHVRHR